MSTQYETAFTIHKPPEQDISSETLLKQAVDLVTAELEKHVDGNPPSDTEQGAADGVAYAAIRAERRHPRNPEHTVRLEARFCTIGGNGDDAAVAVQIHTRYIATDGGAAPTAPAGPPRLLHAVIANFDCRHGNTRLSSSPVPVYMDDLTSPSRTLPALAISKDKHGDTAIDPEEAALWLAGLAVVFRLDQAGIRDQTIGNCYDGSARLYWPVAAGKRAPLSKYYDCRQAARTRLSELQQLCLDKAPESDFEGGYTAARTEVVQERNRQLEAQLRQRQPDMESDAGEALRKEARRERIRAGEASRKLSIANERINALTAELESLNEDRRQSENDEPEPAVDTAARDAAVIAALNNENRSLKAEISRLRNVQADRPAIPLTGAACDNVTIINHAVNIYREPMRRYIAPLMKQELGSSWGEALIDKGIVALDRNRTRQLAASDPVAFIDTDIFADIAGSHPQSFADRSFTRKLREIQGIRNRAAHPPPRGIPYDEAVDGLHTIAEALATIHAQAEAGAVRQLAGAVSP